MSPHAERRQALVTLKERREGGVMLENVLPCKAHCKCYCCKGYQHVTVKEHMESWCMRILNYYQNTAGNYRDAGTCC